eukprot:gnl/TRDRNA2_/TRDRNA2_149318_c0_seq1.p1 gnl/TRDRNA2_/TRDRNA2_149318_c0~~gnl/TRDRNA2_/TRDRNA2_149318_c0_seq1.p1  ORF type:complete len:103 (+),score=22.98 gnl/TRDRNA2_/TRDRNA2_149318_c0_seq1:44-310(+)
MQLQELLSDEGGEIPGAKFKAKWKDRFGEEFPSDGCTKLKDQLCKPAFSSVCSLEMREHSNGPPLLWVVQPITATNDFDGEARNEAGR